MARRVTSRALGIPVSAEAIASLVLYWGPSKDSQGNDTVLTNEGPNALTGVDVGLPPVQTINGEQLYVLNLDSVDAVKALPEGEYDFGVAFKDVAGNESDITEAEDVPLDLTPPAKPTKVVVISAP